MNKRQAQRLLRVARALRESPKPKAFTMKCFLRNDIHDIDRDLAKEKGWCGAPACALGHYASRPDLQKIMEIKLVTENYTTPEPQIHFTPAYGSETHQRRVNICYPGQAILKHFGVNRVELFELFYGNGCGDAKTPIEAAKYIEKFVRKTYGYVPR